MLCQLQSFFMSQSDTYKQVHRSWISTTSGQRTEPNSIFSPKKCSDYLISGKILRRNYLGDSLQQVVIQLSSSLHGNIPMVVLGLHKNSLIVTLINHLHVVSLHLVQLAGWLFHLRMPEEHTTLIRHGQLSFEGTTHQQPKLCAESHSKKALGTCSRVLSHCAWISSYSGPCICITIFGWKTNFSYSGPIMTSVIIGVN